MNVHVLYSSWYIQFTVCSQKLKPSQEEQKGTNFRFIGATSEELRVGKAIKTPDWSMHFNQKLENFTSAKKDTMHAKAYLRMANMAAS